MPRRSAPAPPRVLPPATALADDEGDANRPPPPVTDAPVAGLALRLVIAVLEAPVLGPALAGAMLRRAGVTTVRE